MKTNRTIKVTENKIKLKPGHPAIKQKATHIPFQLQSYVEKVKKANGEFTKNRRGLFCISGSNSGDEIYTIKSCVGFKKTEI